MFGKTEKEPDLEFFTVYDSKSQSYFEPFAAKNSQVVIRDFCNAFQSPQAQEKNSYFINAEDYSLFKIGTFDKKTGNLTAFNREHVANMLDLKAMVQAKPSVVLNKDNAPQALYPT